MTEQSEGFTVLTSPYAVGIDFGTTNSSVAIYRKGEFHNFPIDGNKPSMPSAVRFYASDGKPQIVVGRAAKQFALPYPAEVFLSVKTLMMSNDWEEKDEYKEIKEKFKDCKGFLDLTPIKVAAEILRKIMNEVNIGQVNLDTNEALDMMGEVQKVVICVPANATDTYKKNILEAAKLANIGLKDENGNLQLNENGEPKGVGLLKEPEAAALTYGVENDFFSKKKKNIIMIYDFGGGTLDVTLLEIDSNADVPKFKTLGHSGDNKLGGDDIDKALMELANDFFKVQAGIDLFDLVSDQHATSKKTLLEAQQKLKQAAEDEKINSLANGTTDAIANISVIQLFVDGDGTAHDLNCDISKSELLKKITPMIERSLEVADHSLKEANLTIDDISRIVMVGGSSKADWISSALKDHYDKEPYVAANVDLYVSMGAAYDAANRIFPDLNETKFICPQCGKELNYQPTKEQPCECGYQGVETSAYLYRNIGIETQGGIFGLVLTKGSVDEDSENSVIASASRTFYNANNSENLQMVIWETGEDITNAGESYNVSQKDANDRKIFNCIGEFTLTNVPLAPKGTVPVKVTMELDKNEILNVKAIAEGGGEGEEVTLNVSSK